MQNQADTWEQALRESERATTQTCKSLGRKIELPFTAQPNVRARPRLERSLSLVKPGLLDVLRGLVIGEIRWPLFVYGEAGAGKTRAALSLCDHVPSAYYLTAEQICTEILDRRDFVTWRYLRDYSLVVVDELGTRQNPGDLEYTAVKRVADEREDRATIYISNVGPDELPKAYDDRIASRVLCGTVFHLVDGDRRRIA